MDEEAAEKLSFANIGQSGDKIVVPTVLLNHVTRSPPSGGDPGMPRRDTFGQNARQLHLTCAGGMRPVTLELLGTKKLQLAKQTLLPF
jgi:hypothetical protein